MKSELIRAHLFQNVGAPIFKNLWNHMKSSKDQGSCYFQQLRRKVRYVLHRRRPFLWQYGYIYECECNKVRSETSKYISPQILQFLAIPIVAYMRNSYLILPDISFPFLRPFEGDTTLTSHFTTKSFLGVCVFYFDVET